MKKNYLFGVCQTLVILVIVVFFTCTSVLAETTDAEKCTARGGNWSSNKCNCPSTNPAKTIDLSGTEICPKLSCENKGGSWTYDYKCKCTEDSSYITDLNGPAICPKKECETNKGGNYGVFEGSTAKRCRCDETLTFVSLTNDEVCPKQSCLHPLDEDGVEILNSAGTWDYANKKCNCGSDKIEYKYQCYKSDHYYLVCERSDGIWDDDYSECSCSGEATWLENDVVCMAEDQTACTESGGGWNVAEQKAGCYCDNAKGLYLEKGVCKKAKDVCLASYGTWEPDDENDDETKYTIGKCKCDIMENLIEHEGKCVTRKEACEMSSSGGDWNENVSRCYCPKSKTEQGGKCISPTESPLKAVCEADAGIWVSSSLSCECGYGRVWDGAACIPNCGKDKKWTGSTCVDISKDANADEQKKCSLSKSASFDTIFIYIILSGLASLIIRRFKSEQ